jgi:hypothetical protein
MKQSTDFAFLITTDGSRPAEVERLLESCRKAGQAAIFLLLQNNAELSQATVSLLPARTKILHEKRRIPLSAARNLMLDALETHQHEFFIDASTIILLTDDDCWYPESFFFRVKNFKDVAVCKALDPASGKHFSTFDLMKRSGNAPLARWELMFYGVSISFMFRYGVVKGMRFKENIGLGNIISQGEESLFVMQILAKKTEMRVEVIPDSTVYHPWKFSSSSSNHSSLGYFLGWSVVHGFAFVFPFFVFLFAKYFVASLIRPKMLYWRIFGSLVAAFVRGMFDMEKIGAPHA